METEAQRQEKPLQLITLLLKKFLKGTFCNPDSCTIYIQEVKGKVWTDMEVKCNITVW